MPHKDPEIAKAYRKAYYYKYRDRHVKQARDWYNANRERCIARETARNRTPEGRVKRAYYHAKKGTEFHNERIRKWRKQNPERAKKNWMMYVARRRARLANAQGSFTFETWMSKVQYHGWRCLYCKKRLSLENLTMDHRIPLSLGGSNWLSNIVPACKSCNSRKFNKKTWQPKNSLAHFVKE